MATQFNSLLARWPSSAVVPWVLLAPVVAMASAWLILGQRPNEAEVGGGVLLLVGVLVALRPSRGVRPAAPRKVEDEVSEASSAEYSSDEWSLDRVDRDRSPLDYPDGQPGRAARPASSRAMGTRNGEQET